MTSYQKLLVENKILWEKLIKYLTFIFEGSKDQEKTMAKLIEDIRWEIKRAQHEDKN